MIQTHPSAEPLPSGSRFPDMTRRAETLPIPELIPKQGDIAAMGHNVIDQGRHRDSPLVVARRHHGRLALRAHPTERVPRSEERGAPFPAPRISAGPLTA